METVAFNAVLVLSAWGAAVVSADTVVAFGGRITNGEPAAEGEFPAQLSLQINGSHVCGATLLDASWALTAAQCVHGREAANLVLVAGITDLKEGGSWRNVSQIITHDLYAEDSTWVYDVALLKVPDPFLLNGRTIQAAKLPKQGQDIPAGNPATVVGWGRTTWNGQEPAGLQKVALQVVNQAECRQAYEPHLLPVQDTNICAGTADGNKGFCDGDSGGALYARGEVVGLASFNLECGLPGYPDVYSRVSAFIDWIQDRTG